MSLRTVHIVRKLNRAEWGGTETALERLVHGLQETGVESVIYGPQLPVAPRNEPPEFRRFHAFVPVLGLSQWRRRQLISVGGNLMSFDLPSMLWKERQAAVIHTHTLGRIGGIARLIAKRRRIPFVVSIHGGLLDLPAKVREDFYAPIRGGWDWGRIFGWVVGSRLLLRDADCLITCNETEAALLRKKLPDKRVFVQPHGVPLAIYQQNHRPSARAAFPQIIGQQMLLCVGRIDPIKNQTWLLDQVPTILQKHPGVLLALAGPCTDEAYGESIKRKIRALGVEDRVMLTGGMPPDDPRLIGLMQQAAALVLPSLSETFGLVILEAWAAGSVVVSSRTSGPSALIRDQENGWLFRLDQAAAFHEAIDRALSNPSLVRQMADRGTVISQQYSLAALAGRLKRLYEELIMENQCVT
jgi:glycosyltransferase involved in cell wall biosynthesis